MKLPRIFQPKEPSVDAQRAADNMMSQWSPLENLTPRMLAQVLNGVKAGNLQQYARLWDDIRERDDLLASVEPKRRKDVSRLDWEITLAEDTAAAARQRDELERFFSSLVYTDAMDADKRGGVSSLIRGMMLSVGYGWSVQEIIWRPSPRGLSAQMVQIPLHFFERRAGRLRFLESDGAHDGRELEPGGWLVTACDDKLAIASMVLYLYKHMPLRDWLVYCHRYVVPGLHGKTPARKDSGEWADLRNALLNFGQDWALLTGSEVDIKTIDSSAKGQLPYPPLVDRCDRRLSALWRGADLSTMSRQNSIGASLQAAERETLAADDARLIEEVVNGSLVPLVLGYTFGANTPALASFRLRRPPSQTDQDIKIYDAMHRWGVPVGLADIRERFGVATPDDGEEVVAGPAAAVPQLNAAARPSGRRKAVWRGASADLKPLADAIAATLESDDADLPAALARLQRGMPELAARVNAGGGLAAALEELSAAAFVDGFNVPNTGSTDA